MPASCRVAAILLSATVSLSCQTSKVTSNNKGSGDVLAVPSLGITYTPPAGMHDKTTAENRKLRDRAVEYATKLAVPILDLSSADSDDSAEWHQVWITLFPRAQLAGAGDAVAETKINTALAGPHATPLGESKHVIIGGQNFLVSKFTREEPPLLKHAKIYTTIRKTQLVSFVLVSNSAIQVKGMEESLKSLAFFNP